ncbi:MAG: hypothetical protein CHACPFDD_02436 [Phycisphaerae bacterium]|nr:hypothetical protein [Phycisphaerae bacterium]
MSGSVRCRNRRARRVWCRVAVLATAGLLMQAGSCQLAAAQAFIDGFINAAAPRLIERFSPDTAADAPSAGSERP